MGRQSWSDKIRVERCRVISIFELSRAGVFDKGDGNFWSCKWTNSAGEETASISFMITYGGRAVRFMYSITDRSSEQKESLDYHVEIVTTPCNFGGVRRWFICPLVKNGTPCGKRVGKLYLPPGGKYLGCRGCYDLTYRSCQEHDKRVNALIKNPYLMLGKLQSGSVKDSLLAMRAYFKFLDLGGK
jgi:hypothetical protein